MTTDTETRDDSPDASPAETDPLTMDDPATGKEIGGHRVTDTLFGTRNENHDGVRRGAYPKGLDPAEFVGTLRRFVGQNLRYIQVVGDLDGHAVYRVLNEEDRSGVYAKPWDEFIERTAHYMPDAPGPVQDDPARSVVRTDFETLRRRREQEVETGCSCLPGEACDHCGGKEDN